MSETIKILGLHGLTGRDSLPSDNNEGVNMAEINRNYFDGLVSQLYDFGLEFDVRENYSGRGMYGEECIGFVTDDPSKLLISLGAILAVDERDADDSGATYEGIYYYDLSPRMDNMAFDTIVYFPNISITE